MTSLMAGFLKRKQVPGCLWAPVRAPFGQLTPDLRDQTDGDGT